MLLDDVGFGEVGLDEISVIRGYKTPNISAFAKGGLSLQRMYSEPYEGIENLRPETLQLIEVFKMGQRKK
jgi:hypothetical protein